ncbi:hypothetical protein [Solicola sp. PLA-1-18]|uniref:hypothetical protein n=1 Tax=Solicola sp. PLA-1-18 TaxID=3380532 RepID=UPI003B7645C8
MTVRKSQGGRHSKGDRDAMMIRPPRQLGDIVRDAAENEGMTITDYVTTLLAREHGLPAMAPTPSRPSHQKELPLQQTA